MTTERVRWTRCGGGISRGVMRGNVHVCASEEGYRRYTWWAGAALGRHWVEVRRDMGQGAATLRDAKRLAREAGLMGRAIVGVK